MKIRSIKHIFFAASCLLVLGGCGSKDTSKENTQEFSVSVKQEIPSIDASVSNDVVGWGVLKNTGEGLFRANEEGELVPAGAMEEPVVSEDGLTYTFKLRKNAVWSNGDPIVAEDYVYGWQRTVEPSTSSEVAYLFESIGNYQEIAKGDLLATDLGVKALDDYTLEVTLKYQIPYFKSLLSLPPFFPQNKKVIEKSGNKYGSSSDHMVYNGPFVLSDFDGVGTDINWSYLKNDTYWDKENVKTEKINFSVVKEDATAVNMFESGQVDDVVISGETAQQMSSDAAYYSQSISSTTYVEFNQANETFQNENLRKALAYSLDRETLVSKVLGDGAIASTGIVPKNMSFNPETNADFVEDSGNHLKFDAEKAQEYWAKAKKELGVETLTINLLSSDLESAKKVVEFMQSEIQNNLPGITVEISAVPFAVRLDRANSGDFDMVLVGWGAEYDDPTVFLELFTTDNVNNSGHYSNAQFDEAIKAAGTTDASDPVARWKDLVQAENELMDTMGVCPLYQRSEAHLRNPKLKGVLPAGPEYDYKWTYMEE